MKNIPLIAILFVLIISCNRQNIAQIAWKHIPVQELPYSMSAFSDWDNLINAQDEIRMDPENIVTSLFKGNISINERLYTGSCIDSTVRFFKRLPDTGKYKVLIFRYLNQGDNDSYPAYAMQTVDSVGASVDNLSISATMPGGYSWSRSFTCDSNYIITVVDSIECLSSDDGSEENPTITYSRQDVYKYTINNHGRFIRYYDMKDGDVANYLLDDNSPQRQNIYKEKGKVEDHKREGIWLIVVKKEEGDIVKYVQERVTYHNGEQIME
jgi:hypothetical protein